MVASASPSAAMVASASPSAAMVASASPSPTTTTPVIHGWTMHRYGYSPGSSNVTSNVVSGMNRPLSNAMGESAVLVTVWAAVSSLDHTTVVPGSTDTPAGR